MFLADEAIWSQGIRNELDRNDKRCFGARRKGSAGKRRHGDAPHDLRRRNKHSVLCSCLSGDEISLYSKSQCPLGIERGEYSVRDRELGCTT